MSTKTTPTVHLPLDDSAPAGTLTAHAYGRGGSGIIRYSLCRVVERVSSGHLLVEILMLDGSPDFLGQPPVVRRADRLYAWPEGVDFRDRDERRNRLPYRCGDDGKHWDD